MSSDNSKINFIEEWKTATETSQKFDEFLIDLRKYGFTILTALITAGSFLGFSFSAAEQSINSNILHLGVIYVTMFLVVILFWLDVYYQNLLYGSVLRTRFLEFFRLNYRLSVYISGLYTGSRMDTVLYLLYFGFLFGIFIMGWLVAEIIYQGTPNKTSLGIFGLQGLQILLISLVLSFVGMIYIIHIGIMKRKKKLTYIMDLFKKYLDKPREEKIVMELEKEISDLFPFEV